jgi:hypothetical protein
MPSVYFDGSECEASDVAAALADAGCPAWGIAAFLGSAEFARTRSEKGWVPHTSKTGQATEKKRLPSGRWSYRGPRDQEDDRQVDKQPSVGDNTSKRDTRSEVRPLVIDDLPAWMTPDVQRLAALYMGTGSGPADKSALPILADALEDARFPHHDLLASLRAGVMETPGLGWREADLLRLYLRDAAYSDDKAAYAGRRIRAGDDPLDLHDGSPLIEPASPIGQWQRTGDQAHCLAPALAGALQALDKANNGYGDKYAAVSHQYGIITYTNHTIGADPNWQIDRIRTHVLNVLPKQVPTWTTPKWRDEILGLHHERLRIGSAILRMIGNPADEPAIAAAERVVSDFDAARTREEGVKSRFAAASAAAQAPVLAAIKQQKGYWPRQFEKMLQANPGFIRVELHDLIGTPPPGEIWVRKSKGGKWGKSRSEKKGRPLTAEEMEALAK